jgi:2,4-dienoyl-CoA reductase-like NADH-dependent reductase (Old Yellow Enzyme family)
MLNTISQPWPQPLLTPVRMGKLQLPNRIVMAPLTRMRAANPGHVPTELHAEYYAQRASAGLIIGECTEISPDAYGWADTPGLWSTEQVRGWRAVTEAVHQKGGLMYAQLWHTGAMSHPDFFDGALPMSASDVNPEQESVTPSATTDFTGSPLEQLAGDGMFQHFRPLYQGHLIANVHRLSHIDRISIPQKWQ